MQEKIYPLILDLSAKRLDFPFTIIYGSLEIISSCYFNTQIGNEQYELLIGLNTSRQTDLSRNSMHSTKNMRQRKLFMDLSKVYQR